MQARFEEKKKYNGTPHLLYAHQQYLQGPGLMTSPHWHHCIEMLYCVQGRCEIQIGENLHTFGAGDLVLINSHEVHRVSALDSERSHYLVFKLEPEILFSAEQSVFEIRYMLPFTLRQTPHQKVISAQELEGTGIPGLLLDAMREYEEKKYGYELAMRANMYRVFLWILRRWHAACPDDAWSRLDDDTMHTLRCALDYVEENYAQPIRMEDIARQLHMGYSSFSKFFLRYTQRNFADYVNSVRIQKAEVLLTTTDLNVTEIAMSTGFSTASYFIQRFREANGVTPKRFRAGR